MTMLTNGRQVRAMLLELEDGSLVYHEAPVVHTSVALPAPAPMLEQAKVIDVPPEDIKPKPVRRRRRKAAAPVETPAPAPAAAAPAPVETPTPAPEPKAKATAKKGRRKSANKKGLCVPLSECKGVASYTKNDGGEMAVAIYKTGENKSGTWYLLLFISEDNEWAYHPNQKGFFGKRDKLSGIEWF